MADETEFSRREIKETFKKKLDEAVRKENFEAYRELLILARKRPGSDEFRSLEAKYWQILAEKRRRKSEGL